MRIVFLRGFLLLACVFSFSAAPALGQPTTADPKKDQEKLPPAASKPLPESLDDLKAIQEQVKKVVAKVTPCVVGVQIGNASGSGVIINKDGIVLTAGHVSGRPGTPCTLILPDGKRLEGKSLGKNTEIDSGMIKITAEGKWNFCEMGSIANLKPGTWCIAIGHPNGFQRGRAPVVRVGRILSINSRAINTDCTLVGGDSGGPLFDLEGKVIGIHSRIGPTITSNVHVPIKTFVDTFDRLARSEDIGTFVAAAPTKPRLGIVADESARNCRLGDIVPDSPAERAGLMPGDVVIEFDGKEVKKANDLFSLLSLKALGDQAQIVVKRGAETRKFMVKFDPKPVPAYFGVVRDENASDCRLSRVTEGSPAESAGLRGGDVIIRFAGTEIKNYDELLTRLNDKKPGDLVDVVVKRGSETLTLKVKLDKRG